MLQEFSADSDVVKILVCIPQSADCTHVRRKVQIAPTTPPPDPRWGSAPEPRWGSAPDPAGGGGGAGGGAPPNLLAGKPPRVWGGAPNDSIKPTGLVSPRGAKFV